MQSSNLSKWDFRYLSTYSHYSICSYFTLSSSAKNLVSSSSLWPLTGNPICNKSCSSIFSSGSFMFSFDTYPSYHSNYLFNYHGGKCFSSFSSSGQPSASSIAHPFSKSSKILGFNRFGCRYDGCISQILNLYLSSYTGHEYFRFYSVSASDVSKYNDLHTHGVKQKATRKQVAVIIGWLITEDKDLTTRLNSLSVRLSISSVERVFQVLNSAKKPALHFFHWIRNWQPELEYDLDICSLVVDNCGRLDDYDAMRCLLKDFNSNGLSLKKQTFQYLQDIAANDDLLKKSTEKVIGVLQEVRGTSYASGVHSLIEMFCNLGSLDMAMFVIEKTQRKLSYYTVLIKEMCRKCDFKAARNLMDQIRKSGCCPSTQTYNYIISSLLKNGKNADACELFQEMKDKDCPPDALTFQIFIYNSCNNGKLDNARGYFDDMVAKGLEPRILTHAAFIKGLFNSQQYEKAYEYVVGSDDEFSSCANYSLLARLHQKKGNLVVAESILSEMIKKGLRPDFSVYKRVKENLLKLGNKKLASDLEKKFRELQLRS